MKKLNSIFNTETIELANILPLLITSTNSETLTRNWVNGKRLGRKNPLTIFMLGGLLKMVHDDLKYIKLSQTTELEREFDTAISAVVAVVEFSKFDVSKLDVDKLWHDISYHVNVYLVERNAPRFIGRVWDTISGAIYLVDVTIASAIEAQLNEHIVHHVMTVLDRIVPKTKWSWLDRTGGSRGNRR
jgi:hypothetical protein